MEIKIVFGVNYMILANSLIIPNVVHKNIKFLDFSCLKQAALKFHNFSDIPRLEGTLLSPFINNILLNSNVKEKVSIIKLPLTCMNDDVLGKIANVDKRLVADMALMWSDVVMVSNVIGQLTGLDKPEWKIKDQVQKNKYTIR